MLGAARTLAAGTGTLPLRANRRPAIESALSAPPVNIPSPQVFNYWITALRYVSALYFG
jgi:hypothetical protein